MDDLGPFPTRRLHVADRVVRHLLGDNGEDPATRQVLLDPVPVSFGATDLLRAHIDRGATVSYVQSAPGTAGVALAAGALARTGCAVPGRRTGRRRNRAVRICLRDATLTRRALIVRRDAEPDFAPAAGAGVGRAFFDATADALVPVVVVGAQAWQPNWLPWLPPVVTAEPLSERGRTFLWRSMISTLSDDDVLSIPPFNLTPEQVRDVCDAAAAGAATRERRRRCRTWSPPRRLPSAPSATSPASVEAVRWPGSRT